MLWRPVSHSAAKLHPRKQVASINRSNRYSHDQRHAALLEAAIEKRQSLLRRAYGGNKEIGHHLYLSEHTVKNYVKTILKKLNAAIPAYTAASSALAPPERALGHWT